MGDGYFIRGKIHSREHKSNYRFYRELNILPASQNSDVSNPKTDIRSLLCSLLLIGFCASLSKITRSEFIALCPLIRRLEIVVHPTATTAYARISVASEGDSAKQNE